MTIYTYIYIYQEQHKDSIYKEQMFENEDMNTIKSLNTKMETCPKILDVSLPGHRKCVVPCQMGQSPAMFPADCP